MILIFITITQNFEMFGFVREKKFNGGVYKHLFSSSSGKFSSSFLFSVV